MFSVQCQPLAYWLEPLTYELLALAVTATRGVWFLIRRKRRTFFEPGRARVPPEKNYQSKKDWIHELTVTELRLWTSIFLSFHEKYFVLPVTDSLNWLRYDFFLPLFMRSFFLTLSLSLSGPSWPARKVIYLTPYPARLRVCTTLGGTIGRGEAPLRDTFLHLKEAFHR